MKRFWTAAHAVAVDGGWAVMLDGKQLRSPAGTAMVVPSRLLAEAISAEWNATECALEVDFRLLKLTHIAHVSLDRMGPEQVAALAAYGETDLLCYRADGPHALQAAQSAAWDPILDWAQLRYNTRFSVTEGVIHTPQPPETVARLAAEFRARSRWEQAALHPVITITGSLVIALALHEGALTIDAAWEAGLLDELWQAARWGEDELAAQSRSERQAAVQAGARFIELLRD